MSISGSSIAFQEVHPESQLEQSFRSVNEQGSVKSTRRDGLSGHDIQFYAESALPSKRVSEQSLQYLIEDASQSPPRVNYESISPQPQLAPVSEPEIHYESIAPPPHKLSRRAQERARTPHAYGSSVPITPRARSLMSTHRPKPDGAAWTPSTQSARPPTALEAGSQVPRQRDGAPPLAPADAHTTPATANSPSPNAFRGPTASAMSDFSPVGSEIIAPLPGAGAASATAAQVVTTHEVTLHGDQWLRMLADARDMVERSVLEDVAQATKMDPSFIRIDSIRAEKTPAHLGIDISIAHDPAVTRTELDDCLAHTPFYITEMLRDTRGGDSFDLSLKKMATTTASPASPEAADVTARDGTLSTEASEPHADGTAAGNGSTASSGALAMAYSFTEHVGEGLLLIDYQRIGSSESRLVKLFLGGSPAEVTGGFLKRCVAERFGVPPETLRVEFAGCNVPDNATGATTRWINGSLIDVTCRAAPSRPRSAANDAHFEHGAEEAHSAAAVKALSPVAVAMTARPPLPQKQPPSAAAQKTKDKKKKRRNPARAAVNGKQSAPSAATAQKKKTKAKRKVGGKAASSPSAEKIKRSRSASLFVSQEVPRYRQGTEMSALRLQQRSRPLPEEFTRSRSYVMRTPRRGSDASQMPQEPVYMRPHLWRQRTPSSRLLATDSRGNLSAIPENVMPAQYVCRAVQATTPRRGAPHTQKGQHQQDYSNRSREDHGGTRSVSRRSRSPQRRYLQSTTSSTRNLQEEDVQPQPLLPPHPHQNNGARAPVDRVAEDERHEAAEKARAALESSDDDVHFYWEGESQESAPADIAVGVDEPQPQQAPSPFAQVYS